jgi:hypothetical protein
MDFTTFLRSVNAPKHPPTAPPPTPPQPPQSKT